MTCHRDRPVYEGVLLPPPGRYVLVVKSADPDSPCLRGALLPSSGRCVLVVKRPDPYAPRHHYRPVYEELFFRPPRDWSAPTRSFFRARPELAPLRCVARPGDVVAVPSSHFHATENVGGELLSLGGQMDVVAEVVSGLHDGGTSV